MLSTSFPSSDYREEIAQVGSLAVTWRRQRRLIASPEALRSYEEDFLVRMAYNSNAIEGSTLTLAETEIIYEGEFVPGKPGRAADSRIEAFSRATTSSPVTAPISGPSTKTSSWTLTSAALSTFNPLPAASTAMRRPSYGHREPRPPPLCAIREEMDDLIFHFDRLVQESSPLLACAWFHAAFEAIHPFADGNGRARALAAERPTGVFRGSHRSPLRHPTPWNTRGRWSAGKPMAMMLRSCSCCSPAKPKS